MNHTSTRTATEKSQKSQQGSGRDGGRTGGYVPIYHDVEENTYGPDSPLDRTSKVFLCIRHKTLRDADDKKYITKEFIIEKTGLSKDEVKKAIRKLEQNEMILVHRSKTGKVWNTSEYQLHPKRFGNLFNWYKNNPKFTVIRGGKADPNSPTWGDDSTPGVGDDSTPGVGDDSTPGNALKFAELIEKISSNNPCIKNPKKTTQRKEEMFFLNESEEEIRARNKAKFERQRIEMGF